MKCPECGSKVELHAASGMELVLLCQNPKLRRKRKACGWYLMLYGSGIEPWFRECLDAFVAGLPQEQFEEVTT